MIQRLYFLKESIKGFFRFVKWIPSYYLLHKDYGYDPRTYGYIIENYQRVLCERTQTMSKPTYHWQDVVSEIDRWYEED